MDLMHIAEVIKSARKRQHLTVDALAGKASVSKGFISRLENFRATPSLATLTRIAGVLGVPMKDFFEKSASPVPVVFGRLEEGQAVDRDQSSRFGMKYLAQAWQKVDRGMQPFLVHYAPSSKQRGFLAHDSEEFFLLLEGNILFFTYDEKSGRPMGPGDNVYLAREVPHQVRLAKGCRGAKALVVYRMNDPT